MSDFNVLVNKIIEDAQVAKQNIINKAKEETDKIVSKKIEDANELKKKLLEKAHVDGKELKEKLISKSELKVRNNILLSKRKILDEVFEKALIKLSNLDSEKFIKYIVNTLKELDMTGEYTMLVPEKYVEYEKQILEEVNNLSNIGFKIIEVKKKEEMNGGFILEKDGVFVNYSFKLLVEFIREQIEFEILTLLFE